MTLLSKETFVCVDIESTGLEPKSDRIIEIAAIKFNFNNILETYSTLINPQVDIPLESQHIHNISNDMVQGKPLIKEIIPKILDFIGNHIIVGHGIKFDIDIIDYEAQRYNLICNILNSKYIDTLRLARLYGESPFNSLKELSRHFNLEFEGAHRALNDVIANIKVFKKLSTSFTSADQILKRLDKPILLKKMPLGKHKGRAFNEIPIEYLRWAASKDFDFDLLYSLRSEINNRKKRVSFERASNPFLEL